MFDNYNYEVLINIHTTKTDEKWLYLFVTSDVIEAPDNDLTLTGRVGSCYKAIAEHNCNRFVLPVHKYIYYSIQHSKATMNTWTFLGYKRLGTNT